MIHLKDIVYSYSVGTQSVTALKGIDIKIDPGDLAAIQGPSGSGKSTLLYVLGCLLKPDKGEILFDGKSLAKLSEPQLALLRNQRIGFVFQQFHLLPRADVVENILLPSHYPVETAKPGEAERKRAIEIANQVGLGDRLDHLPNQLSGGQQQRVAIGRALMNQPDILLADEPTGNLDSKSSEQILALLKVLNRQGITVVIITHDNEVAAHCHKVYHLLDGEITEVEEKPREGDQREREALPSRELPKIPLRRSLLSYLTLCQTLLPRVWENLRRNKARTLLTMLGITIGITAVLSMVSLGQFTKEKILESYAVLGVDTLMIRGRRNWDRKATDWVTAEFQAFDPERDIKPLPDVFPEIEYYSPAMGGWRADASFGGKIIESEVQTKGVAAEAFAISRRELAIGQYFSPLHVDTQSGVCVIGYEVAERLFVSVGPIGQIIQIKNNDISYPCRVMGVLAPISVNNQWFKPNLQVIMPYTYFQAVNNWWDAQISTVILKIKEGYDVEKTGKSIQAFLSQKYGKSGRFRVSGNSLLVAQMNHFLSLFTIMLGVIALISLAVGGIGITNMMLVSVSERVKEIGLRKALGATNFSVRFQFLLEAVAICALAGVIGLVMGFVIYQSIIYGASTLMEQINFEWVFVWEAIILSFISIVLVGIASGLVPALKAERLQVIEALRTE